MLAMSVFPGSALSSAWSCLWKAGRRPGGRKEGNATKGCQPGRPSRCHPTHSFLSFLLSYYSHSHHPQQHHRDLEECLKIVSQRERRGGGGGTWEPLVCVCWGPTLCSSAGLPLHSRVQCSQVDSHGSPAQHLNLDLITAPQLTLGESHLPCSPSMWLHGALGVGRGLKLGLRGHFTRSLGIRLAPLTGMAEMEVT